MISLKSKLFYHSYTLCVLAFKTPVRKQILNMKRHAFIPCCRYAGQASQEIFSGKIDIFKGITVDTATLKCEQDKFEKILGDPKNEYKLKSPKRLKKRFGLFTGQWFPVSQSLKQWNIEGKRCIWFKVNIRDACYVPILAKKGFNFHHARGDFVMMYKWLPKDVEANLPPSSYTNVGVGAMVFNKEGNLLTLSEKNYDYAHWKLPGGYVEKGEDLIDAAVREVKEETGIESAFESLVTFRHTHEGMFGNSDIYVLIMMKALSEKIFICRREIRDCKWMTVEEFTTHPDVHKLNKLLVLKALEYKKNNLKLNFVKKTVKWSTYVRKMNFLLIDKYN